MSKEYVIIIESKLNKIDLIKIDKMLKAVDKSYTLKMFEERKPYLFEKRE